MKHPAQEALEFLLGLTAKFSHDPGVAKRANEHLAALDALAVEEMQPPPAATNEADPEK
jgi:hypothetical protein